ncbi:hypothetical protein PYCCODRAFT_512229 [Trametes coccinea BRFM310]|uniref:CFA20 domain-containing protein n=1 Tax=Trametes coccinea (strain BRFM310) TaxID=1353009 RepID=A0A1Y2IJW4_TRAC3|nr:hypothetical protein PYCCODRAFT_512229 [Trametes coccinea BRFM310]
MLSKFLPTWLWLNLRRQVRSHDSSAGMFAASIQPSLVSLFSSTGSEPLGLFSSHVDASLPSDSFICALNDASSQPPPSPPRVLVGSRQDSEDVSPDYALGQTVLHIQSPTLRNTFIRCPPAQATNENSVRSGRLRQQLGLKHPWMHIQVRDLRKEWAFEVGIVDQSGREGIVRCATFQREPKLKLGSRPLLILPLSFPPPSSRPLTSWCTVALNLPSLLPHFSSATLARANDDESHSTSMRTGPSAVAQVPSGIYSHVSYVKVYATCRLRRIWFSEGGPQQQLPWEFGLYGSE